MNSTKKSPTARGVPSSRQVGSVRQFRPAVTQLKTGVPPRNIKQPVAPPVYKPQPLQKVGQRKTALATGMPKAAQPKMANGAVQRKPPVAPPVYRPQPAPKVLQTKSSVPRSSHVSPVPKIGSRVASGVSSKARPASQIIQRTPEEGENLRNLGLMWCKHAEEDKTSGAKVKFFKHVEEIREKINFNCYTVWHKHDLYVGGGKNKNYVKIVQALQGADAGKTSADEYIAWAEGPTSIIALSHALQELVLIVHIAEVGRGYLYAPEQLLQFMNRVSAASIPERIELWKNFKNHNQYAFTATEDSEYVPSEEDDTDISGDK